MKGNRRLLIVIVGFCTLLLAYLIAPTNAPAKATVTITGAVYEDDWDENDNPTAVVIEATDGEEYKVSAEGKGKELLKLGDKNVKATGFVVEDKEGWKTITVTAYEVIE